MSRARVMRFTKIKFDGQKVRLEYEVTRPRGGDPDEFAYASNDRPRPEFVAALQALVVDVCSICEFPASEAPKFTVRGVSLGYTDDVLGACITALRALMTADTPLCINSPFLPETPRSSDPSGYRLPVGTVRRLRGLLTEAERYLEGERAFVAEDGK